MARRRTAKEWGRLIRELERSGQAPAEFARARGIRPDTLKWWRWRLAGQAEAGARAKKRGGTSGTPRPAVRLVAVEPAVDLAPRSDLGERSSPSTPVWELESPSGHVLRVYDRSGLGVLRAALSAVAGKRQR